ncbi:helix-turn-helix domain-containing protein [Psychrobacillus sp. FSL H8-0510]|uniref:helix-turn-helix domain-containing protein n=1 Tax=Psychrobacillus sp. FSL H8-0510 TaxID=2921394 RepID=UPI0030F6001C
MSNYGGTIKRIRKNKGYTQKEIVGELFTQSTYSNFESEKSDILSAHFMHLLLQIQISTDELRYIHNGYKHDVVTEIVNSFFRLSYNNKYEITNVITSIDEYLLNDKKNILLEELRSVCEALLIVETTGDFEKAREKVNTIWERISRYDQWYLTDIRMMNVILYFFEDDVVIYITEKLLERLNKYKAFNDSKKISTTLILNLSLLLIKSGRYSEALDRLVTLLDSHMKDLPYRPLTVCFNRMAICYSYISKDKELLYKQKITKLLDVYEDDAFKQMVIQEHEKYSQV